MEIVACYSVWNVEDRIEKSIESLKGFADRFVFIDGSIPEYLQFHHCYLKNPPSSFNPCSTDKTIEICSKYGEVTVPIDSRPWATQIEKRNEYFKRGHKGDWMLVIDSDEIFNVDLSISGQTMKVFKESILNEEKPSIEVMINHTVELRRPYPMVRLYKWSEGLHYCRNHATVFGENDSDITSMAAKRHSISITNDHSYRKKS